MKKVFLLASCLSLLAVSVLIGSCKKDANSSGGGTTLSAPKDVSASQSGTSIIVSWSSVPKSTSYNVYRSNSSTGKYSQIGSSNSTNYADYSPLSGDNYYKVTAENNAGESPKSDYAYCNYGGGGATKPVITINNGNIIEIDAQNLGALAIPVNVTSVDDLLQYYAYILVGYDKYTIGDTLYAFYNTKYYEKTYTVADVAPYLPAYIFEMEVLPYLRFGVFAAVMNESDRKEVDIEIVNIPDPETPLEDPKDFTWHRIGGDSGQGLDMFGLAWSSNTTTHAVITPLSGTKLVELSVYDWNIATKEELKELVDSSVSLSKWEKIPHSGYFNYVIATKTVAGDYFLINPTESSFNPDYSITITGKYKK